MQHFKYAELGKFTFIINPALTPFSNQIFARIAASRLEFCSCIYNITSEFTTFQYALVDTETSAVSYLSHPYSGSGLCIRHFRCVYCHNLDSRRSFTYNSNTFLFTIGVNEPITFRFYLLSETETWATNTLNFPNDADWHNTRARGLCSSTVCVIVLSLLSHLQV
jgi:hypothetical protein